MSEKKFEEIQPRKEQKNNYKANINDWATAERAYDPKFADKIDEERTIGFQNIERLNLPRFKHATMKLSDFLANPDKYLANLDSDIFYISLMPKTPSLKREGRAGISAEEVKVFITEFVTPENIEHYEIALNQMFDNIFGGSTIVDTKGNVYFEFIEGNQTDVSKGNAEIKYIVSRDTFTGSFKYSFEDEGIRMLAFDALMNIPHDGEGRDMKFLPGYYEMVIAQRNENTKPETKFLDYRDNDSYQIDWDKVSLNK